MAGSTTGCEQSRYSRSRPLALSADGADLSTVLPGPMAKTNLGLRALEAGAPWLACGLVACDRDLQRRGFVVPSGSARGPEAAW